MNAHALRSGLSALTIAVALSGCAGTASPPPTYPVKGTVEDASGMAESTCSITAEVLSGGPVGELALQSDAQGEFTWPLPAGEYLLTATCADASGSQTVTVAERATSVRITVA